MAQGAATFADVLSASWSLALDVSTAAGAPGDGIGSIVQGIDDIDQCIGIILKTIPGEDPFRPTFGCNLTQYVDKPLPVARSQIAGAVTQALELWEPRLKVLSVASAIFASNPGSLTVTVTWRLNIPVALNQFFTTGNAAAITKTFTTTVVII